MKTHLTRRGRAMLGIAALATVMAWGFGSRSLNAVIVPSVALVVASWLIVYRLDRPSVDRDVAEAGYAGETRTVTLTLDAERSFTGSVVDRVPEAIGGDVTVETVVDERTITYDLDFDDRGVHRLGPAVVVARDLFGLWERSFFYPQTTEVVAYPRVRPLGATGRILERFVGSTDDREHFDGVREYQRGDSLRDVNWKASAKRPGEELIVTTFAGTGTSEAVLVLASAEDGAAANRVAEATASVAGHLLDVGLDVGVVTDVGVVEPDSGDAHRRDVLDRLARMGTGAVRPRVREQADITVHAAGGDAPVQVDVGGSTHRFTEFVATPAGEVAP